MARITSTFTAAALTALFALPALAADKVEVTGGQLIVGTGNTCTAYYAPSSAFSIDGSRFFLYVQGDDNVCDSNPPYDQILMYDRPNTWESLTTPFTSAITILPNPSQGHHPNAYYGEHAVFIDANQYFMTAGKSYDGVTFRQQLFGSSADGSNWTWSDLFFAPPQFDTPDVTLKYALINGQHYWWGFVFFRQFDAFGQLVPNGSGLAAIRIPLTRREPGLVEFSQIEFKSGGVWQSVGRGQTLPFTPDLLMFGGQPKLHFIDGEWQVWVSTSQVITPPPGPPYPYCYLGEPAAFGSGFNFYSVTTEYAITGVSQVWSTLRRLPADYSSSRVYPDPLEGTTLLYSASNDLNCRSDYRGQYIVVTSIQ